MVDLRGARGRCLGSSNMLFFSFLLVDLMDQRKVVISLGAQKLRKRNTKQAEQTFPPVRWLENGP